MVDYRAKYVGLVTASTEVPYSVCNLSYGLGCNLPYLRKADLCYRYGVVSYKYPTYCTLGTDSLVSLEVLYRNISANKRPDMKGYLVTYP